MKQSISTHPTNVPLDLGVRELRLAPIESVYLWAIPPPGVYLHGPSVEFFFSSSGELAISGEIIQVAPKEEAFHLAFTRTLGLEYWRNEVSKAKGSNVAEATDLSAKWRGQGLDVLLSGPRDVCLYTRGRPEATRGRLAGVEIIAKQDSQQRILLVASEGDPGDVIVITPSGEYEQAIARLIALDLSGPTNSTTLEPGLHAGTGIPARGPGRDQKGLS
jgi:hypothetical protein